MRRDEFGVRRPLSVRLMAPWYWLVRDVIRLEYRPGSWWRYVLIDPADALHYYPRRYACWAWGVHSKICAGRRDEAHEMWRLELRLRLRKQRWPWWDEVSLLQEIGWRWRWLRDWVPLPERVDLALSARVRRRMRYPIDEKQLRLDLSAVCRVCQARWLAGRGIAGHDGCATALGEEIDRVASRGGGRRWTVGRTGGGGSGETDSGADPISSGVGAGR